MPASRIAGSVLLAAACLLPGASPGVFNVREYGAAGDGRTLDTAAINKAIEACAAVGGGQVLVPPGTYLSGTVRLRSNVTLRLEAGARLAGADDLSLYQNYTPPAGSPEARNPRWHRALVLGVGVENVSIVGEGTIDGRRVFDPEGEEKMRGPHAVLFGDSRGIVVRGVTIADAANYAILLEWSDDIEVRNVRVTGGWDAVHFRHNRNVIIADSQFYTGDDCVAGRYWENVLVTNCVLNSSCNPVRVIGPARNLIIHGSLLYGPGVYEHRTSREARRRNTLIGVFLQPGSWGGTKGDFDDILLSDLTMHNVQSPFRVMIHPGNRAGRITIQGLKATGVYRAAASVLSQDAPIERLVLRDIDVEFAPDERIPLREIRPLPVWGFVAENVRHLVLDDIRLRSVASDTRPALRFDNIEKLEVDGLRFTRFAGAAAPLALNNVASHELRDAGWAQVEASCAALRQGAGTTIIATIRGGAAAGLGRAELSVAGRSYAQWVWLDRNETKDIAFESLPGAPAGEVEVRCGSLIRRLRTGPSVDPPAR